MIKSIPITISTILMCAAIIILASCDKEDGDWDSMFWKAEVPVVKSGDTYEVPFRGATLTFRCLNYSRPWIEHAESGEELPMVVERHYYPERESNDFQAITADWFKAEIVGKELTVSFEPNDKPREVFLYLTVTAGDVFHTFKFKQHAHQK